MLGVGGEAILWGWIMVEMKILSYNVRGLGSFEKRAEVRNFIREKHSSVVCLQESNLGTVDDFIIKSVWGYVGCEYSYQASMGASGGLLTVWDPLMVEVWCTVTFRHVLIIKGKVRSTGQEFIIANVYAPCDTLAKQELWVRLSQFINDN